MSNAAKVGSGPPFWGWLGGLVRLSPLDRRFISGAIGGPGPTGGTAFNLGFAALQIFTQRVAQAIVAISAVVGHERSPRNNFSIGSDEPSLICSPRRSR